MLKYPLNFFKGPFIPQAAPVGQKPEPAKFTRARAVGKSFDLSLLHQGPYNWLFIHRESFLGEVLIVVRVKWSKVPQNGVFVFLTEVQAIIFVPGIPGLEGFIMGLLS